MIVRLLAASMIVGALSSAALAADLPNIKGPPVFAPPPPVFSWTGVYIGGQVGYQWGESSNIGCVNCESEGEVSPVASHDDSGIVGGAHIGYNWQVSQFVFGLEGDVNGSSYTGASQSNVLGAGPGNGAYPVDESTRIGIEGSIRGRAGIAWDRVLIYGSGGVAFASVDNSFNCEDCTDNPIASVSTGRVGWTAGGGIEYAVTNNWSIRAEYRYSDYGNLTYSLDAITNAGSCCNATKHITDNQVTAGFSYKFDMFAPPAPVVARY